MKKHLLITGATCYMGVKLSQSLCEDYSLTLLLRNSSRNRFRLDDLKGKVKLVEYSSYDDIDSLFANHSFQAVLHLATGNHIESFENILETNIIFSTRLAKAYSQFNPKGCFINIGTYSTYNEQGDYQPNNLYDASKKAFEDILDLYKVQNGINIMTLYFSHIYGLDSWQERLMALLINSFKEGSEPLALTEGKEFVNHLFIDDAIKAFQIALDLIFSDSYQKEGLHKRYFLVSNETLTLRETAQAMESLLGKKANVVWGARPYTKGKIINKPYTTGDRLPMWEPKYTLERVFENFKESP